MPFRPMKILMSLLPQKASRPNNVEKQSVSVSGRDEASTNSTKGYYISSSEYDWETLDDHETWTKCRAWETLSSALNIIEESSLVSVVNIPRDLPRDFSSDRVLQEAFGVLF